MTSPFPLLSLGRKILGNGSVGHGQHQHLWTPLALSPFRCFTSSPWSSAKPLWRTIRNKAKEKTRFAKADALAPTHEFQIPAAWEGHTLRQFLTKGLQIPKETARSIVKQKRGWWLRPSLPLPKTLQPWTPSLPQNDVETVGTHLDGWSPVPARPAPEGSTNLRPPPPNVAPGYPVKSLSHRLNEGDTLMIKWNLSPFVTKQGGKVCDPPLKASDYRRLPHQAHPNVSHVSTNSHSESPHLPVPTKGAALRNPVSSSTRASPLGMEAPVKDPAHMLEKMIAYEDEHIIVFNKPSGLAIHGGTDIANDEHLVGYLKYLNRPEMSELCRIVHRIDKLTSGLVLAAKSRIVAERLSSMIQAQMIMKEYLAVVKGYAPAGGREQVAYADLQRVVGEKGVERTSVLRESLSIHVASDQGVQGRLPHSGGDQGQGKKLAGRQQDKGRSSGGRDGLERITGGEQGTLSGPLGARMPSETHFRVLSSKQHPDAAPPLPLDEDDGSRVGLSFVPEGASLMWLHPVTGRKHQLRALLGDGFHAPMVGDYVYGFRSREYCPLHLHMYQLTIPNYPACVQSGGQAFYAQLRKQKKESSPSLHDPEGEDLSVREPQSEAKASLRISAPLPDYMAATCSKLHLKIPTITAS